MTEDFDDVVREYIDFVNQQVGVYMDALAGFAGHRTRVERQVHRIMRPRGIRDEKGQPVTVWVSYEDPSQPDIVHNRIIRASDYIAANSEDGSNAQQHSQAVLVFLFTYWEDEIRPRLAASIGVEVNEVRSDIMGDLRIVRNVILHSKSIVRSDKHKDLKKLGQMFAVDQPIHVSYYDMHRIFVFIKQDCARLLLEWLGVEDAPIRPEELRGVAIQKTRRTTQASTIEKKEASTTKSITGLGKMFEVQASRHLDTLVDPTNKRLRIGVMLEDSAELHLWMAAEQFQQSLALLKLSAQKLDIQWP